MPHKRKSPRFNEETLLEKQALAANEEEEKWDAVMSQLAQTVTDFRSLKKMRRTTQEAGHARETQLERELQAETSDAMKWEKAFLKAHSDKEEAEANLAIEMFQKSEVEVELARMKNNTVRERGGDHDENISAKLAIVKAEKQEISAELNQAKHIIVQLQKELTSEKTHAEKLRGGLKGYESQQSGWAVVMHPDTKVVDAARAVSKACGGMTGAHFGVIGATLADLAQALQDKEN